MHNIDWNVLDSSCPSRTSLARIANKWTALIIIVLARGPLRFTDLHRQVEGISGKVLSSTLKDLQRDGVITRTSYAEVPPRVEYELTPLEESLLIPLTALAQWAHDHIEEVLAHRQAYDAHVNGSSK